MLYSLKPLVVDDILRLGHLFEKDTGELQKKRFSKGMNR
jgi:hypothetical protein